MINNDWDEVLSSVWNSPGYKKFMSIIDKKYSETTCFPEYNDIFNALKLTPYSKVKVVILGQDPYHGTGEAHGLSFSVKDDIKKNSRRYAKRQFTFFNHQMPVVWFDVDFNNFSNTINKVIEYINNEKDKAASHKDLGWEILTDHIIKLLNMKETPIVFILWGNFAKKKKVYITNKKHLIIESPHPSPFSAYTGFFGSKPFSKTNNFLIKNNIEPIDFNLNK